MGDVFLDEKELNDRDRAEEISQALDAAKESIRTALSDMNDLSKALYRPDVSQHEHVKKSMERLMEALLWLNDGIYR